MILVLTSGGNVDWTKSHHETKFCSLARRLHTKNMDTLILERKL